MPILEHSEIQWALGPFTPHPLDHKGLMQSLVQSLLDLSLFRTFNIGHFISSPKTPRSSYPTLPLTAPHPNLHQGTAQNIFNSITARVQAQGMTQESS